MIIEWRVLIEQAISVFDMYEKEPIKVFNNNNALSNPKSGFKRLE